MSTSSRWQNSRLRAGLAVVAVPVAYWSILITTLSVLGIMALLQGCLIAWKNLVLVLQQIVARTWTSVKQFTLKLTHFFSAETRRR